MKWESNYLAHYGVLGMKWGRRKQYVLKGRRTSSNGSSRKSNNKTLKKIIGISALTVTAAAGLAAAHKFGVDTLVADHAAKTISSLSRDFGPKMDKARKFVEYDLRDKASRTKYAIADNVGRVKDAIADDIGRAKFNRYYRKNYGSRVARRSGY